MADFRGVRVLQLGVPFQYVATNVGTPAATLDHPTSERAVTLHKCQISLVNNRDDTGNCVYCPAKLLDKLSYLNAWHGQTLTIVDSVKHTRGNSSKNISCTITRKMGE